MYKRIKQKHRIGFGVDLSTAGLQVVEGIWENKTHRVKVMASITFSNAPIKLNTAYGAQLAVQTLRTLLTDHSISTQQAVIAIPDSLVMRKVIYVSEKLSKRELSSWIARHIEEYFSIPSVHLRYDFCVMPSKKRMDSIVEILVIATRIEHIQSRLNIIQKSGLKASIVEVESNAMTYALSYYIPSFNEISLLLLRLNNRTITSYFFDQGQFVSLQENALDVNQILVNIEDLYNTKKKDSIRIALIGFDKEQDVFKNTIFKENLYPLDEVTSFEFLLSFGLSLRGAL